MADTQRLKQLKTMLGIDVESTTENEALTLYLQIAERRVLNKAYPYGTTRTTAPNKYSFKVLEIAQYLYLRRGSEGEKSHSENGVSRSYENADIPDSMLSEIVSMVGAVGCD